MVFIVYIYPYHIYDVKVFHVNVTLTDIRKKYIQSIAHAAFIAYR